MTDEFIPPRHIDRIVKRIILTLETEARKLKGELEFHSVRDAEHITRGFYRAIGVVKRFESKEEKDEPK